MRSNQKSGEPLSPLEGHFGTVTALAYNAGRLQLFRWDIVNCLSIYAQLFSVSVVTEIDTSLCGSLEGRAGASLTIQMQ